MAYRNKTFVSFDGDNDIHYYRLMCAWKRNDNIPFNFFDAHDLNTARDSSLEASIKRQLRTRLLNAKIELIGEIVRSFIAACREDRLADNLTIVVRPEDVKQGKIDVEEVGRLLEHECSPRFRVLNDAGPSGHPIE